MDFYRQSGGGWQLCDEGCMPLQTALAPAPENMLRIISCSCLTDCSTLRCTCKKHNIECTPAMETAGDRAMMWRKCKSLDCSNVFLRFTRTVSALFSYFMMTFIMRWFYDLKIIMSSPINFYCFEVHHNFNAS